MKVTGLPLGADGEVGLILMPVITAELTVKLAAGDEIPLLDAVMFVPPTATPVATPEELPIVAMPGAPDIHVT